MGLPMTMAEVEAHNARVANGRACGGSEAPAASPGGAAAGSEPPKAVLTRFSVTETTDEAALNKTEKRYYQHLKRQGYQWLAAQAVTLKIADDCRLTPDFAHITREGQFVLTDVKGFQREDALIKMKVAARMFPWARFEIVTYTKSGWEITVVKK